MITVSDMMSHLSVQLNAVLAGTLEAKVRTSVLNAWGRLMSMHEWGYFYRQSSLIVYAGQTTGTVDFDVDTSEVTITDGTWPTDAVGKHIRLTGQWFPVVERTSATVIVLDASNAPAKDLDDESYVLQQLVYPLPYEVGDIVQIIDNGQSVPVRLSILENFQILGGLQYSTALPVRYSLVADSASPQKWNLWVPSYQPLDVPLQYLYIARRPPNAIARIRTGTVSVSGGTATFSDPVITTDWNGVLLRVSKNDDHPTNEFGDTPGNDVLLNQDCYELRVTGVTSSTVCTVSDTTATAVDKPYNASSMIDVSDGLMEILLQRLCEEAYGAKVVGNHSEMLVSKARVSEAFNEARASDARRVRHKPAVGVWYSLLSRTR